MLMMKWAIVPEGMLDQRDQDRREIMPHLAAEHAAANIAQLNGKTIMWFRAIPILMRHGQKVSICQIKQDVKYMITAQFLHNYG